ncbi:type II/IV secretion system protein [Burkholderia pseudomallei]|nr:type II/IV secretion system protein [Burkholderia pseudomallei]CFW47386.1 type II/IV secretion system protein [Burkholderia pseudomallei]VCA20238.1 type II/IV secretion system protein [Burkholderia pseudomallei]VCA46186.1 type II/IV secretion system protein [Burkholderia pseudomallei]VCA54818.1 type II/IV secretion system protein [Burkholderia pseudomallei]
MPLSAELRNLTVARASSAELARQARAEGMASLRDAALARVRDGTTSLSEALATTEAA